ncbi:hypothetical protein [Chelativorans sp.]|uniref:hypothetical protein n=1 Tax=Chelativorans sp. TaxID=2203393 RepID=UPI0028121038|nr:hypothetical protein [Chelativorans sp.]
MWTPDPSIIITAEQKAEQARQQTLATFKAGIQAHIDVQAQERDYADGHALANYANSTVPQWKAEAETFIAWRDAVWVYSYAELSKVQVGERPVPALDEFLAELPNLDWPIQPDLSSV